MFIAKNHNLKYRTVSNNFMKYIQYNTVIMVYEQRKYKVNNYCHSVRKVNDSFAHSLLYEVARHSQCRASHWNAHGAALRGPVGPGPRPIGVRRQLGVYNETAWNWEPSAPHECGRSSATQPLSPGSRIEAMSLSSNDPVVMYTRQTTITVGLLTWTTLFTVWCRDQDLTRVHAMFFGPGSLPKTILQEESQVGVLAAGLR